MHVHVGCGAVRVLVGRGGARGAVVVPVACAHVVLAVPVEVVVEAAMVTETVEFTMNSTKVRQFSAVSTAPDFSNADAG